MYAFFLEKLTQWNLFYPDTFAYVLTVIAITVLSFVVWVIVKSVLLRIASKIVKTTSFSWDNILVEKRVVHRIAFLVFPTIFTTLSGQIPQHDGLFVKVAQLLVVLAAMLLVDALVNAIGAIYAQYEVAKVRPIHSVLQVCKGIVIGVAGVIGLAVLVGQSPAVLLGGLGAMTAVTSLIFKDAIVGFVAGIQLTANDMIRIGDWIEVPNSNANGTVTELSMTTVKVQNFDNTTALVPAYLLVSNPYINWRGMTQSGGRRIKRALALDATTVRVMDPSLCEKLQKLPLMAVYFEHNAEARTLTNVGAFRAYLMAYLKAHPAIHQEMTILVRQLDATADGLPIEIYAFTNTTDWIRYEDIQSDLFDHVYAIVAQFDLKIYQRPSGMDMRSGWITERAEHDA